MPYKQYTHCTELGFEDPLKPPPWYAKDLTYKGNPLSRPPARVAIVAIVTALATSNPAALTVALVAGLWAWRQYCNYALDGKLICLPPKDQCAIGRIVELEPPGYGRTAVDPQNIDNDYAVDLLLSPHTIEQLMGLSTDEMRRLIESDGLQGYLIAENPSFVREQDHLSRVIEDPPGPFPFPFTGQTHTVEQDRQHLDVPILHCEFEGARPHDVCAVTDAFAGLMGPLRKICDIPILGPVLCAISQIAAAPIVAPAAIVAWFAAHDGDPADAASDPSSGSLGRMNLVVITGDWVYDAGHNYPDNVGWNEIHPAKRVQKLQLKDNGKDPWEVEGKPMETLQRFQDFYKDCCRLMRQADDPGVQDKQKSLNNRWYYHPAVDGLES